MFLYAHRFVFALMFLLLLTIISESVMAQNSCPEPNTKLIVHKVKKKTQYLGGYTAQEMTQMHMGSVRENGPAIYGTGGGQIGIGIDIDFNQHSNSARTVSCISLDEVVVRFIAFPAIMVAEDFRPGTCEYKAVMKHEKKHISTMMNFQTQYAPKLKHAMKKILRKYGQPQVVSRVNAKHAMLEMKRDINMAASSYFQNITPILHHRQARVDAPEEYARVFAECNGWARATAPKYKRRY